VDEVVLAYSDLSHDEVMHKASTVLAAGADFRRLGPRATMSRCVLCVEDGPTITHGGMPFGAATVAAEREGAALRVDPRATAVGSIARVFEDYPHIGAVLPAMGYGDVQLAELEATINATDCDVVVSSTPVDLGRLIETRHPIRHVRYELEEIGPPTLEEVLRPIAGLAEVERDRLVEVRS
jgi:predicted GTPase